MAKSAGRAWRGINLMRSSTLVTGIKKRARRRVLLEASLADYLDTTRAISRHLFE
ncbi:MAG: hypothetical protein JWR60_1122 [Polaromonas sp.]|nr:hypothetical protein [Polaromonas sp.]